MKTLLRTVFSLAIVTLVSGRLNEINEMHVALHSKFINEYLKDQSGTAVYFSNAAIKADYFGIVSFLRVPMYTYGGKYLHPDELPDQCLHTVTSLVSVSQNHGTCIIAGDYSTSRLMINEVISDHPNQKLVIGFVASNQTEIERLLKEVWINFRQINIFVVDFRNHTISINSPYQGIINHFSVYDDFEEVQRKIFHITYERTHNLHKSQLDVYLCFSHLVSEPIFNDSGEIIEFEYIYGNFMKVFAHYLNFTPKYAIINLSSESNVQKVFDKIRGVNMVIGSAWWLNNGSPATYTTSLYPVGKVYMYYMVPISYQANHLDVLIYTLFDVTTRWICFAFVLLYIGIWTSISWFYQKHFDQPYYNVPLNTIAILFSSSTTVTAHYNNRVFFLALVLFSMVINNMYQGTIVKQLSVKSKARQITTLEQLLQSNLNISSIDYLVNSSRQQTGVKLLDDLFARQGNIFKTMDVGVNAVAINQSDAVLIPDLFVPTFEAEMYDKETGRDLVRGIKESPLSILIAFLAIRSYPLIEEHNHVALLYMETGLYHYEKEKAMFETRLYYIQRIRKGKFDKIESKTQPIVLRDLEYLLLNWVWMLLGSCGVFILENVYHKLISKKMVFQWF